MSQAFYRKWRPSSWEQVIGQEHVVQTLKNAVIGGRIGHAFLFSGPRGTGKTTTARLLAKAMNCTAENPIDRPCNQCKNCQDFNDGRFLDLIEIDAASNTSVDDVRDLRDKINFSPGQGRYKVYIIDEVHMLSTAAFNALLKTLEEPPPHAIFILATTEIHKIPATVLSRCQRHEFRRIPVNTIVAYLQEVAKNENLQVEPEALVQIARQATGSMRDAISLLDQISSSGEGISLEKTQIMLGTATNQAVIDLVDFIICQNPGAGINLIHQSMDNGTDPRQLARQIVEYLRNLLLYKMGSENLSDATPEVRTQIEKQSQQLEQAKLINMIGSFNNAANEMSSSWQPGLLLEMAFVQSSPNGKDTRETEKPIRTSQVNHSLQAKPGLGEIEPKSKPILAQSIKLTDKPPSPTISSDREANNPEVQITGETGQITKPETQGRIEDISTNWIKIKALVKKQRPSTEALLNSCKSKSIKNGTLILTFASDVVKIKMDTHENLDLTSSAIEQIMGIKVPILCVVMNKATKTSSDIEVDEGGMVDTALNLGGQIVSKD